MGRLGLRYGVILALTGMGVWVGGCNGGANLFDIESLRGYLRLTPAQGDVVSGHVLRVVTLAQGYIRTFQERQSELGEQNRRRMDERTVSRDPKVESARQEAVAGIERIAADIRRELTPEQQVKFDRIVLPDLKQSPQELQFMMMQSRRGTFAALQVKPSTKITPIAFSPDQSDSARYQDLKQQRTIVFGPGGFGAPVQQFPLFVTATLIDSALIEAENRCMAPADSLDGAAGQARRQAFLTSRQAHRMFTIRLVLSTFLHESYTSFDRWVVFIEDQDGNRFEPARLLEDLNPAAPEPSALIPFGFMAEGDVPLGRKTRQYDLRFPYRDDLGYWIIGPDTRVLRLVLFDKNDPENRTQGEWMLR